MSVTLKGDKVIIAVPTIKQKALKVNLNDYIYGSFAEIGAGQETVRNFFRAGGASQTIAKAMSAYDKVFSDEIYGVEDNRRYVTEQRLKKMLSYEINLLEERISRKDHPDKLFFTYANTVTTIDFAKKFKGHGWLGIKYQLSPLESYNEIILHVRFKETDVRLQQETLGMLGTNLIHGAFYQHNDPKELLLSLYDNIDKDKIEIDMVNFSGPRFQYVDNRLMSLYLVKYDMTNAVMFGPDGNNLLPAQELYKKNVLSFRGSFRPITKVVMDLYRKSTLLFAKDPEVDPDKIKVVFEISMANLRASNDGKEIDERDFLDRADLLASLGTTVMITHFREYYTYVEYLSEFTTKRIGLGMGIYNLIQVFEEKYYTNLSGGILEAIGKLFSKDIRMYLYPLKNRETKELTTTNNIEVHQSMHDLFEYYKRSGFFIDIENYDLDSIEILSRTVYEMINKKQEGWEAMLPDGIATLIKEKKLFGYR